MAKVGLSKPYYALYSASGSTVTYSDGGVMGKAVNARIEPEDTDTEIFYADNGPAESASVFNGGTLTLEIDRLLADVVGDIFGISVGSSTTPTGSTVDFSGNLTIPYVGVGMITKSIVDNTPVWLGIILPKVQFTVPTFDLSTQGEEIEFSGHELTATIMRDDTANANWQKLGWFSSEADAETWIKGFLSITGTTT